jgi:hypothetical protein
MQVKLLNISGHSVDLFYVLLLHTGKYEFLPELYDVLGKELTLRVMDIFAGTSVKFPNQKVLARLAAEVEIYVRVGSAQESQRASVIHSLAEKLALSEDHVREVYNKTRHLLEEELGVSLRERRLRS